MGTRKVEGIDQVRESDRVNENRHRGDPSGAYTSKKLRAASLLSFVSL